MLAEILKAFEQTGGPLDLKGLSRRLGTERSALEGMLETLVRQGKLRKVNIGSDDCAHCGSRSSCAYLQSGDYMGKVYELVEKRR
ncbi:MAG: helix-turn-helix domain-containing protein [Dehalococcoidales bacterium]|nr:helix-turn-helix domain-containing protein [Dehalococcoidales bacterium]